MERIYVLLGKSCSGKDSMYKRLLTDNSLSLRPVVTYTTRPMRTGEKEGREYHFTSMREIHGFMKDNRIIESRAYRTAEGKWTYATVDDGSFDTEEDVLMIGTPDSVNSLSRYFGKDSLNRDRVVPLLIDVKEDERRRRAILREKRQKFPDFKEMERRLAADEEDFSEERLSKIPDLHRFDNSAFSEEYCADCLADFIRLRQFLDKVRNMTFEELGRELQKF